MKKIIIALSLVVATSSAAFAGYSYGDGSPLNNADIYTSQTSNMNNQNISNKHSSYNHQSKVFASKSHLQNKTVNGSLRQYHYGDGSPANQGN